MKSLILLMGLFLGSAHAQELLDVGSAVIAECGFSFGTATVSAVGNGLYKLKFDGDKSGNSICESEAFRSDQVFKVDSVPSVTVGKIWKTTFKIGQAVAIRRHSASLERVGIILELSSNGFARIQVDSDDALSGWQPISKLK